MRVANIIESSSTLSARDRLRLKDTTNAEKLDKVLDECGTLTITPAMYAVLHIVPVGEDDKEYDQYVIVADDNAKYVTGSTAFWLSFKEIWDEMHADSDEPFAIDVYKVESKNYKGKSFITCSIH